LRAARDKCARAASAIHIPGSARTRHHFGDEVGAVVTTSRHAETAASPRDGAQGWTACLAPRPSARQGGPAPRGDHHRTCTMRENDGQDRRRGRHRAVGRREALRSREKHGESSSCSARCVPRLPQVAKCGADELACKPRIDPAAESTPHRPARLLTTLICTGLRTAYARTTAKTSCSSDGDL
jgi:hypothetical protein